MPQNGDRIVAVDSVTLLHPIYSLTMQCIFYTDRCHGSCLVGLATLHGATP